MTNQETFDHIPDWYEESKVHVLPHTAVYILVGNKIDLPGRQVSKREAEAFARENGMPYLETSSVTGVRIDDSFTTLGQIIFSKLKSGEIQAENGWEAIKDPYTADQKVKLGASNREDSIVGGTRCSAA